MTEDETIQRTDLPVTIDSLARDLAVLGVERGSILLVHSSLSSLGWVCGGAVAVVDALQSSVGKEGTLVMPTFSTGLSEPSEWCNPPVPKYWWPTIRAEMPAFDPATTPTRGIGAIAESFRTHPGVVRSNHPHYSFAARGPQAADIMANHRLEDGLGEASPLASLYDRSATVLLLGVGHENSTSLHLSEHRGLGSQMKLIRSGGPVLVNGERKWVKFRRPDYGGDDFATVGDAFAEETDLVKSGMVGIGLSRLMPQRELVDFAAAWIAQNRTDDSFNA